MTEIVEAPVQVSAEQQQQQINPFGNTSWTEELPTPAATTEKPNIEVVPPVSTATTSTEVKPASAVENEIPVPIEWLKKEFGVEDFTIIKTEREELKKLKETPSATQEYQFANDESKKMAEAISKGDRKAIMKILETQERLETYTSGEVTDDTAPDIIKLGMQLKYKDLSPSEIEYKYNKEFGLPKAPTKKEDELDEEFDSRKSEWQERVSDIKMNRNIEAKLAKPELEKLKSTIVIPEFSKPAEQQVNEPDPVEMKRLRDNFLQALDSNYSKVEGFKTLVKDESVEIPISFNIPDDAKVALKGRLTEGVDIKEYIDKRWFDEKWNPNVDKIMSDLYQLENLDKILSGVANNAANKRLEEYIRQSKNPDVRTTSTPPPAFQPNNNGNVSPFSNESWSEKPPIIQN